MSGIKPIGKDDFTAEEHQKLDTKLQLWKNFDHEGSVEEFGPLLLYRIVTQLGDRARTTSFDECETLVKESPSLQDLLKECLKDGSFSSLRRLEFLRKGETGSSSNIKALPAVSAVKLAWTREYLGEHPMIMLGNINDMKRSDDYANSIAFVQSSGTGKSRMVDEMAKYVFTIPFNLRNPEETLYEGAYPPEDTAIWSYLCDSNLDGVDEGEKCTTLFFQELFSRITIEVKNVFSSSQICLTKKLSPDELALKWQNHLSEDNGKHRKRLYESTVQGCKESTQSRPASGLTECVAKLLSTLTEYCSFEANRVKIMLYFDEAHELGKKTISGQTKEPTCPAKTRYDIVWSTLHKFKSASVFTVFLSTHSTLALLAPSADVARSSRQKNPEILWGPITETPFDCHPSFPIRPGEYILKTLAEPEFLMRFGRPLFWAMVSDKKNENNDDLLKNVMELARKKLLFNNAIDDLPDNHHLIAKTAILDVLIAIDYEPARQVTHDHEMNLVESHMRIAFSVPGHRLYIRSGYPSEPYLAEAAARQMHHYMKRDKLFSMAKLLSQILDGGLLDLGQKGEVVARQLLLKAYMDAVVIEQNKTATPNFSTGCSFLGFLDALFPHDYQDKILDCTPDTKSGPARTLEDAFRGAFVRFTHFVRAADSSTISARGMLMAFLRGCAIVGHITQHSIDIAIPILLDAKNKIQEAAMTALLVQVKRRHQAGSVNAYLIDAKKLDFFCDSPGDSDHLRPYVTLITELGVSTPPSSMSSNVNTSENRTRSSARLASMLPQEHPRYTIRTYGCSNESWKVIRPDENDFYTSILSTDNLLADHPRQNERTLQLVRQLLPFWYGDPRWFADGRPKYVVRPPAPVEVGQREAVLEGPPTLPAPLPNTERSPVKRNLKHSSGKRKEMEGGGRMGMGKGTDDGDGDGVGQQQKRQRVVSGRGRGKHG